MLGGRSLRFGNRISDRWEKHRLTGNVGMLTAYWFSILKVLRIILSINFILQILYSAWKFQDSVLVCDSSSSCNSVESRTLKSLQFFHFIEIFSWASRRSQFCFNNCSWRSWWSCRRRSSAWARWSSSCFDSIVPFNFCIFLRSLSAWNSFF